MEMKGTTVKPDNILASEKVTLSFGVQYGLLFALMTFNWLNSLQMTYWSYFMTDICLIGTATMGTILIISRIADLCSIPIAGIIMEKTNLKWGKVRSWLIIGPVFLVIMFMFMFINYGLNTAIKAAILCSAYGLAGLGINTMVTAHNTVNTTVPKNIKDRAVLSAKKGQGSAFGAFFFGLMTLPLIRFFGASEEVSARGLFCMVIVYGLVCILANFFLFKSIPKEVGVSTVPKDEAPKLSVGEMFAIFVKDVPLIGIILADGFRYVAWMGMMSLVAYYFINVLNSPDMISVFFSVSGIAAIIGSIVSEILLRSIDKRKLYITGMLLLIIAMFCAFFFAKTGMAYVSIISFGFLGLSFINCCQVGMYSDAVDYGVYKAGKDCKAFLMALAGFAPKIGVVLSSVVVGAGLTVIGYDATAPMTPQVAQGINVLMNLLPASLMALGLIVLLLTNRLDNARMLEIRTALAERETAAKGRATAITE